MKKYLFFIMIFSCLNMTGLYAQRVIKGIVTSNSVPQKDVKVSTDDKTDSPGVFTNEKGEFFLIISPEISYLGFLELNTKHPLHVKINLNDTLLQIDIDKIKGIFTWAIDASLAISSSYLSTYQVSGNNNNLTSLMGKVLFHAEWKRGKYTWINDLNALYGQAHTSLRIEDSTGINIKGVTAKSGDLFSFTSKFAEKISNYFHLTVLANFQSQFTPGYRDPYAEAKGKQHIVISDFLAPAVINLGIGIDFRPFKDFNIYYSPCDLDIMVVKIPELRLHFDLFNGPAAYEFGSFLNLNFKKEIMKNITYSTKLQLFTNYLTNKEHPEAERPGSIDVQLWQNTLSFKFNSCIMLNFNATLMYDEDDHFDLYSEDDKAGEQIGRTGPRTQYFHNIGIGIGYIFSNRKH